MVGFTVYDFHVLRLLFAYEITTNMRVHNQEKLQVWKENWYSKHRWIVLPRTIIRFLCIQTMIYCLFSLIVIGIDPNGHSLEACHRTSLIQEIFWNWVLVNEALAIVFIGIVGFKLRGKNADAFSIKLEVTVCFYTAGVSFLTYLILINFPFPATLTSVPILVVLHCGMLTLTVMPYYLSRKEKRMQFQITESKASFMPQLIEVLTNPEGFQAFLRYLETEFSSENLLFWDHIDHIKKLEYEGNDWKSIFATTYKQFCKENAPCQVNLPHTITEKIRESIDLMNNDKKDLEQSAKELLILFDEAQRNIYDLMSHDSFPRFQRIPAFLDLYSGLTQDGSKHGSKYNNEISSFKASRTSQAGPLSSSHELIQVDDLFVA